jgi:peroxisomal 3,2-trans-enoyl-CoA isomerase
MQTYKTLAVSVKEGVALIKFTRPDRYNSFNRDQYEDIAKALEAVTRDDNAVCAVLTGSGKYYSSGNDMSSQTAASASSESDSDDMEAKLTKMTEAGASRTVRALIEFPKPLFAAVNGPAIGFAVTTLALCDIVYCSDTATFNTPFMQFGFCAEGCSSLLLPEIMGTSRANEMLLLGKTFTAQEAHQTGLVSQVFPVEQLLAETMKRAKAMAAFPAPALRDTKALMRSAKRKQQLHDVNNAEMKTLVQRFLSPDCQQAVMTFMMQQQLKKQASQQNTAHNNSPSGQDKRKIAATPRSKL